MRAIRPPAALRSTALAWPRLLRPRPPAPAPPQQQQQRALASATAARPLDDGITRLRNRRVNPVDRDRMARERELWMIHTLGLSAKRAKRYAYKMPPCWAENLPGWTAWLQDMFDFSPEECMAVFQKDPAVLGGRLDAAEATMRWMMSSEGPGWSKEEVARVFLRVPALFNKSPEKMQETMDWFRNEYHDFAAGQDYIAAMPIVLQASIHGRIRPRYDLARQRGEHPGKVSLTHIYQSTDPKFAKLLGIRYFPSSLKASHCTALRYLHRGGVALPTTLHFTD
jgi:hypothetical protein